ncbi:MAG: phage tail sheath C-terminal domain-containing protein [Novosphingobium sp.]
MKPRRRLPGIVVEPLPPVWRNALPPMDIAAFAGFAERGPCNRAIAVDSVAAYEACFGGDTILARRPDGGGWARAALPATVRAFFGNGGRRCWVVRLARTAETERAWAAAGGRAGRPGDVAEANLLPVGGVLWGGSGPGGGPSRVQAARLQASSVGSWSDALRLSARLQTTALRVDGATAGPDGFRFADPGGLVPDALIELVSRQGSVRSFARVTRREGGDLLASWCASFLRTAAPNALDAAAGHVRIPGLETDFDATFHAGEESRIELSAGAAKTVAAGDWLRFAAQGETVWMLVDRATDNAAEGPAWQEVASSLPTGAFWARTVTLELAATRDGSRMTFAAPQPGQAGDETLDDDAYYARASQLPVARAPLCLVAEDRAAPGSSWLPLGLTGEFGPARAAVASDRPALARDGLARFDAELFLDPVLASCDTAALGDTIQRRRDIEEAQLTGIHALADTPDAGFGLPSILAVPDALQPGWSFAAEAGLPGPAVPGGVDRSSWSSHAGGCPRDESDVTSPASPRTDRFLDCGTRKLLAPGLHRASGRPGSGDFVIEFTSPETGATFVLEESGEPGFAQSAEIYRGQTAEFAIVDRPDGVYYYRLRIEVGANSSDWAAIGLRVRSSEYVAGDPDPQLLHRLHVATLRLAAGTGEMMALLGLPESWRAAEASGFMRKLKTLAPGRGGVSQLGQTEERTLSYGALFHPWLAYRTDRERRIGPGPVAAAPPLGCIAGTMARTARDRGAWIAHANIALADVIGLAPALPEAALGGLQDDLVNLVRRLPQGFMVHDNDTLSSEPEWKEITVRRLMILLRRVALEQGTIYVFEPQGPVLRRAVENHFDRTLDDLQRRGAFAGARSSESFTLRVDARPGVADQGRLEIEIGVAPSIPMRFLSLRLLQQGGRLTLAEEAA